MRPSLRAGALRERQHSPRSLDLVAEEGERVFAFGLALLITVDLLLEALRVASPARLEAVGQNLLAALVILGVAVNLARGRLSRRPAELRPWHALALAVPLVAVTLQTEVPLAYRLGVVIGVSAFVAGLFWGDAPAMGARAPSRADSGRHLAPAALALAIVFALHDMERTPLVTAVQVTAGGYLILLAPGSQLAPLLVPKAAGLEQLAWGVALSMAALPVTLMWLIWLGIDPTREAVLLAAASVTLTGAALVRLLPDRLRLPEL